MSIINTILGFFRISRSVTALGASHSDKGWKIRMDEKAKSIVSVSSGSLKSIVDIYDKQGLVTDTKHREKIANKLVPELILFYLYHFFLFVGRYIDIEKVVAYERQIIDVIMNKFIPSKREDEFKRLYDERMGEFMLIKEQGRELTRGYIIEKIENVLEDGNKKLPPEKKLLIHPIIDSAINELITGDKSTLF